MMRVSWAMLGWGGLCTVLALNAAPTWGQGSTPATMPVRLVVAQPAERPVFVESVRIETDVAGTLATTSVELVVRNPNGRVLEAELQFPLLAGQQVTGYALDIDGRLRDAVPVEKPRAQEIFEDIVRRGADPGLLQVTQGNQYRLRVYPLPAGGARRMRITYSEALAVEQGAFVYRLPLEYGPELPSFALDVRLHGATPEHVRMDGAPAGLTFVTEGGRYLRAHIERERFSASGRLTLRLPAGATPVVQAGRVDGQGWFYAEVPVRERVRTRAAPRRVALYWDASGSGARRELEPERSLLAHYLRMLGNVDVDLVTFRHQPDAPRRFEVRAGDAGALLRALSEVRYDGATALGALVPVDGAQESLLFTDGLSNFGPGGPPRLGGLIHVITSSAGADTGALRALAEASGGRWVDLPGVAPQVAARLLREEPARVLDAGGDGLTEVLLASPYAQGGRLRLAGRVRDGRAELVVRYGLPGSRDSTVLRVPVAVDAAVPGLAMAQAWARLKLASLDADRDANRAQILRVGRSFRVPTAETSLLVLETAADYARFDVEPPVELAAEVARLRATTPRDAGPDEAKRLASVADWWAERERWWATSFPKEAPAPVVVAPGATGAAVARGEAGAVNADSLRRAAPPGSPAMPAPAPAAMAPRLAGVPAREAAKVGGAAAPANEGGTSIALRRWTPDVPYLRRLEAIRDRAAFEQAYFDERPAYEGSSAFFLDVADLAADRGWADLSLQVLGNLAEMALESRQLLRILGHRLAQAGQPALAVPVFQRVARLAPNEPQSWRDLGRVLAATGQWQQAADHLYRVVRGQWNQRFPRIQVTALAELNAMVATAPVRIDTTAFDARLMRNLPVGLRVVLTWDSDATDVDLWVDDPNGERVMYNHQRSAQGGRISPDFTGGYGPEEFVLRDPKPGRYTVRAQYYGNRQQILSGAVTLQAEFTTGFGTAQARTERATRRLRDRAEVIVLGEFEVAADGR